MERRKFGNTDMEVSPLGFGAAEIGFENADVATVEKLLGSALDAGLNVIDTAACYNNSEELIGKAAGHRRDEYFLFTKCGHKAGLDGEEWTPQLIEKSIERSLRLLQTDRLDLLQLHSCGKDVLQKGEVIEAVQKARDAGKTRYIGYSGDNEAAAYAIECGAFDALQTSINIADQRVLEHNLPAAQQAGMGVIAKRPIANAAWRNGDKPPGNDYHDTYWQRLQKLDYEFLRDNLGTSVGIALRFTLSQPGVCTAIVGTTKPGRWNENARYIEAGALPDEMIEKIRARWSEIAADDWNGQG